VGVLQPAAESYDLGEADPEVTMPLTLAAAGVRQLLATSGQSTPTPEDWRDCPIYFLMIDRFAARTSPPRHQPWDDPSYSGYQGGTFRGIQEQLGYIKDLGFGAVWLSPALRNADFRHYDTHSYHGYGIVDFLSAEPRFAEDPAHADDELRELVDAAHAIGLAVVLDIVLNHTGDVFAYQCDPADTTCTVSGGAEASFTAQTQPVRWRDADGAPTVPSVEGNPGADLRSLVWPVELQQEHFFRKQGVMSDVIGDFASLKQMLTVDPALQDILVRSYEYLIARFDIDGFRIDTLRYLQGDLPRIFGNAMREFAAGVGKRNFFTYGEVWSTDADIARFVGRNTNDASELVGVDAALDFPLMYTLNSVAKGFAPPTDLMQMYAGRRAAERNVLSSHGDATRFFVTFLDNHDTKERARDRQPDASHPFDQQLFLRLALLATLPGIPCVYYGTEQGLDGRGSDEAVREALWGGPGFDPTSPFYTHVRAILNARATHAPLRYGRHYFRPVSGDGFTFGPSDGAGGVVAFSRILANQENLIVANTSTTTSEELHVVVDRSLTPEGTSMSVVYSNNASATAPSPAQRYATASVTEVDGSHSSGPLNAVTVHLAPMEVQILAPPA